MNVHPKERWSQCYYLSSTSNIADRYLDCFGYIISVQTAPRRELMQVHPWCMDNDEFNDAFDEDVWTTRLDQCQEFMDNCLFVLARDKVGDWRETIERFKVYGPIVRAAGYPVGFATQDGLTVKHTPWNEFDALFVGGTDRHKLGPEAGALIAEGIKRGKWIHIGRVNSPKRMRQFWRADSWDGTHIGFEPDRAAPKIAAAVREIRVWQQTRRLI